MQTTGIQIVNQYPTTISTIERIVMEYNARKQEMTDDELMDWLKMSNVMVEVEELTLAIPLSKNMYGCSKCPSCNTQLTLLKKQEK